MTYVKCLAAGALTLALVSTIMIAYVIVVYKPYGTRAIAFDPSGLYQVNQILDSRHPELCDRVFLGISATCAISTSQYSCGGDAHNAFDRRNG